uniref:Uncharacterized protein n=1 Tax=Arundo donax TaxID=35708 RepID=A0A0A8YE26_ARUDO
MPPGRTPRPTRPAVSPRTLSTRSSPVIR